MSGREKMMTTGNGKRETGNALLVSVDLGDRLERRRVSYLTRFPFPVSRSPFPVSRLLLVLSSLWFVPRASAQLPSQS